MMRPENDVDARCSTQGCTVTVNLWDYPEALHDSCGEVTCNSCGPCRCDSDLTPCCPDPECGGAPCDFPGYAENH